jgi:hypothetical protein
MHVLGAHGRIACQLKLTVRLLLHHPHSNSKHRTLHVHAAEQLQQQPTSGRGRQWLRNTVFAVTGGAGISLAVASGGERFVKQSDDSLSWVGFMLLTVQAVHLLCCICR